MGNPACVSVIGSSGRRAADSAVIPNYDGVQIVVLDEEASKRQLFERNLTCLLNRTNLRCARDLATRLCHLEIEAPEEMSTVIRAVLDRATEHVSNCEAVADALVELKEKYPSFAPDRGSGKPIKFTRLLLGVCQEAHEGFIVHQQPSFPSGLEATNPQNRSARLALAVLFGRLFSRGLLHQKVVGQAIDDFVGPKCSLDPVSVECACCLLEVLGSSLDVSLAERTLMSQIAWRLTAVENAACTPAISALTSR